MLDAPELNAKRSEILKLRARVVVLERMMVAALELALRIRPEELTTSVERERQRLADGYDDPGFAADISDPRERAMLASDVERMVRAIQSDLGFEGGISSPENG